MYEATIVGLDDLNNMNFSSNKPLAIAIGYRENILKQIWICIFDDTLIFEDILYDNKHLMLTPCARIDLSQFLIQDYFLYSNM